MGQQDETLETDPVQLLAAIRQYFDAKGNKALDEFNVKDTLGASSARMAGSHLASVWLLAHVCAEICSTLAARAAAAIPGWLSQ